MGTASRLRPAGKRKTPAPARTATEFGGGFRSALSAPRKRVAGLRSSRPQTHRETGSGGNKWSPFPPPRWETFTPPLTLADVLGVELRNTPHFFPATASSHGCST